MKLILKQDALRYYLCALRVWFGTLLIYHGLLAADYDSVFVFIKWVGSTHELAIQPHSLIDITKFIEVICGVSVLIGLFTRITSGFLAGLMIIAIIASLFHLIALDNGNGAIAAIFFWFSAIILFYGTGKWSLDGQLIKKQDGGAEKARE